ncbi:TcpQ domain-containing protein [Pandoraea cepalis]|nr:TcpQ domain-containing protein [Pandoraea cepalis]
MKRFVGALAALAPLLCHGKLIVVEPHPQPAVVDPPATASKPTAIAAGPKVAPVAKDGGFIDLKSETVANRDVAPPSFAVAPLPEVWVAKKGATLRGALSSWARKAGWNEPIWKAYRGENEVNFAIDAADVTFTGTFDQAVAQFIRLYSAGRYPLRVQISVAQKLVIVSLKN